MRRTSSTLIAIVLTLLALGIVMLASTSGVKGAATFGDPHYFVKRQLVWLLVAALGGACVVFFDYHWWRKAAFPLFALALVGLTLVFVPHVGARVGGSNRWLRLGPMSVQPSEFAKCATIIVLSSWMAGVGRGVKTFRDGLVVPMVLLGTVLALMLLEPDFGTTLLTGIVGMAILFVGGTRVVYLFFTALIGASGFLILVLRDTVRQARILAFLMPDKYPRTAYHLAQSEVSFIKGGVLGAGLGKSIQKQLYLPEAHTDFILAIIGEELGVIASLSVVLLFAAFLACGIVIAVRAPDRLGRLLGFGFTLMVALQAAINIGVVTGCLPTKGLPLPFISYGGSSLIASVLSVAVLLNVARHGGPGGGDEHTRSIRDRAHRI